MSSTKRSNSSRCLKPQFAFGEPLHLIECMWADLQQVLDESVSWTTVAQQAKASTLLNKKIYALDASWESIAPTERAKLSSCTEVQAAVNRDGKGLPTLIKQLKEESALDQLLERFDELVEKHREQENSEKREKAIQHLRDAYRLMHTGGGQSAEDQTKTYARSQLDKLIHGEADSGVSSDSESEDNSDNELLQSDKSVRTRLRVPELIVVGQNERWWRCTPKDNASAKLQHLECSGMFWNLGKRIAVNRTWQKAATSSDGKFLFIGPKDAQTQHER